MAFAVKALVAALAVGGALASPPERYATGRQVPKAKGAAPAVRFSVNGVTVLVPDQLEIYYDSALLDPATLTLTVRDTIGNAANCTDALTRYVEYAAAPWKACAAPVFAAGTGRYILSAEIEPRAGGAPQVYSAGKKREKHTRRARARVPRAPERPTHCKPTLPCLIVVCARNRHYGDYGAAASVAL